MSYDNYKLYLLIPDGVPAGFAINGAAHAGCCAALKWKDDTDFTSWAYDSFRKVTCRATPEEIERCETQLIKRLRPVDWHKLMPIDFGDILAPHRIVVTESDLDNRVVAVIFKPRDEWPECFKALPLYG